jgi:hypothetical protein
MTALKTAAASNRRKLSPFAIWFPSVFGIRSFGI